MTLKASQPYWYTLAQKSVLAALVLVACQPVWLCFGQPINGTLGNGGYGNLFLGGCQKSVQGCDALVHKCRAKLH